MKNQELCNVRDLLGSELQWRLEVQGRGGREKVAVAPNIGGGTEMQSGNESEMWGLSVGMHFVKIDMQGPLWYGGFCLQFR